MRLGAAVNLAIRLHIAYFLGEVLLRPHDPRFERKALPVRNLLIVGALSLVVPALHRLRRRWSAYPFWTDSLYLSLYWLDMAGNSFDLYDRHTHFDLIPHFHGTGAATIAVQRLWQLPAGRAIVVVNGAHLLLELQENLTDVFLGTRNVRGWWDTAGDLAAGLLGSLLYPWIAGRLSGRR